MWSAQDLFVMMFALVIFVCFAFAMSSLEMDLEYFVIDASQQTVCVSTSAFGIVKGLF